MRTRPPGQWLGPIKFDDGIDPVLRVLFKALDKEYTSIPEIARRSGVSPKTIFAWSKGTPPRLTNVRKVLAAMGFSIVLRRGSGDEGLVTTQDLRPSPPSHEDVIRVCESVYGLMPGEILGSSLDEKVSSARAMATYIIAAHLGHSSRIISELLSVSRNQAEKCVCVLRHDIRSRADVQRNYELVLYSLPDLPKANALSHLAPAGGIKRISESPRKMAVLRMVDEAARREGMGMGTINHREAAEALGLSKAGVVDQLRVLCGHGLLERVAGGNRKSVYHRVTDRGHDLLAGKIG